MSPPKAAVTTTEIYDQALKYCRDFRLPAGAPRPCSTAGWLEENIAALERYREWLESGGTSQLVIRTYHLPMAGHVLGLNHKPSRQLDPDQDFQKAMDYLLAKGHGLSWIKNCRNSLAKFRRFLLHERGLLEVRSLHIRQLDPSIHHGDLIRLQTAAHPAQQILPQAAFTRIFRVHSLKGQRTGQALLADLTHFANDAENHRRKSPVGGWMVVLARAVLQSRTPESRDIHRNGPVAFVDVHLPAGQTFDVRLPQA
jgi:hypothetical protein